ncbi:MAG: ABC-2 type transport system permease protein [Rickettsiales bacterium]|jgi:ABC-2 type transport system permease protein
MSIKTTNYYGTYSLFKKEVLRFLKVYHQTLFSPTINALLLLAIFSLSIGDRVSSIGNVPFKEFMAAGLVMMVAMQNSFANSSSSLTMGKIMGHIIDYLIPPIGPGGILIAFASAAVLRGIVVGIITFAAISLFVPLHPQHIFYSIFCLIFASFFLGLLGIICGILSDSFDQMSAITSYLITPLTFLSGTFYSTKNLPEFWQHVAHFNPFFYMIDGFRYGMTGYHDGDISTGAITILLCNAALATIIYCLLKKGYRIKS